MTRLWKASICDKSNLQVREDYSEAKKTKVNELSNLITKRSRRKAVSTGIERPKPGGELQTTTVQTLSFKKNGLHGLECAIRWVHHNSLENSNVFERLSVREWVIQRRERSTFNKRIRGDPVTFQPRPVIGEGNTERRNKNSNPTLITIEATVHQDLQKHRSGRA